MRHNAGWMKMRRHYRTCTLPNSGPEDFAGMGKGGGRGPDCHVYFPEQTAFPIEAQGPKNLHFQARSKGGPVLGDLLGLLESRWLLDGPRKHAPRRLESRNYPPRPGPSDPGPLAEVGLVPGEQAVQAARFGQKASGESKGAFAAS